ncbi:hypothetical protein CSKR_103796 [Clonorchis sinensis]|uniref:Uncharacterized protein n=1 Tax=Clonorchis sinensis TaxID=79923 RepID=A0A419PYI1_CLOSI|nr:hypothetical protein CSKR_103796 [Clonorchis sinensis]
MFYLNPNWADCDKYTNLQINLVFSGDSGESLVYGVLQLNVLHTLISRRRKVTHLTLTVSTVYKLTTLHKSTDNYGTRVAAILPRKHVTVVWTLTKGLSQTTSSRFDLLHISHCIYFYTCCNPPLSTIEPLVRIYLLNYIRTIINSGALAELTKHGLATYGQWNGAEIVHDRNTAIGCTERTSERP